MPSKTEKAKFSQPDFSDLYGAGGEPSGEPPAPPPRTGNGWQLGEETVAEAVDQARLRRAIERLPDDQRHELVGGLLAQLGDDLELPEEVNERLLDSMLGGLLAGKRTEAEVLGRDGLLGQLTRRLIERALDEERSAHLGYPPGQAPPGGAGNSRNGTSPKTLLTDHGRVRLGVPRDRKSRFEPQLVKKGQRRLAGLDEKIIALYAGGMTTREIETYISELYGPGVSRETVSRVTAGVLQDAEAWQTRPLEALYPILYLDALVIKIRDGHAVRNFACYLAIGVNLEGERDVLGMWFQRTEGAKFWLQVLTDLKTRGVSDVLVCCVDGLQGFPEAIEAVFPHTWVQTCLVHLVRSSLRFVPDKHRRQVAKDLKAIYTAPDRDAAWGALERFAEAWDAKYPMISATWTEHWERIVPFLAFPPDLRRAVYTTDEVSSAGGRFRGFVVLVVERGACARGSLAGRDAAEPGHGRPVGARVGRCWACTSRRRVATMFAAVVGRR
jgi:putative transposase